jgi:hypothetical protein
VLRHSIRQSVVGGLLPDPRWILVGLPLMTTPFDKVPRSQLSSCSKNCCLVLPLTCRGGEGGERRADFVGVSSPGRPWRRGGWRLCEALFLFSGAGAVPDVDGAPLLPQLPRWLSVALLWGAGGVVLRSSSPAAWGGLLRSPRPDRMGVGHPLRSFTASSAPLAVLP